MVGVPRSKGCKTCVQRRVKCDETRPSCTNCIKGGRDCPGYNTQVIFRDEGPRLRKKHAKETSVKSNDSVSSTRGASDSPPVDSPSDSAFLEFNLMPEQQPLPGTPTYERPVWEVDARTSDFLLQSLCFKNEIDAASMCQAQFGVLPLHRPLYAPAVYQQQLLYGFSESIAPTTKDFLPSVMKTQWMWLRYLPEMCGTDVLLDAAMRALTLVQLGRRYQVVHLINDSRPYYGTALRLLSQTLTKPQTGLSSNTLCATALLSFYEMFASTNNASWIRHAGGVGALMRQRGAARHRHGFGREILRAYRYTLVIEAFQKGKPCFLHEPEWRKLQAQVHDDIRMERLIADERMALFDAAEMFFANTTETTQLCAEVKTLPSLGTNSTVDRLQAYEKHLEKLERNRQALKDTNSRFEQSLKEASMLPTTCLSQDPVFPIQYDYGNLFISLFSTGYRSVLGIVNTHILRVTAALVQAGILPPTALAEPTNENRDLSIKLCQSVPYMLKSSFLGPFYAVFGLRFASMTFSQGEREWDWVVDKLNEIGQRYLMMAKHLPWYEQKGFNPEGLQYAIRRSHEYKDRFSSKD